MLYALLRSHTAQDAVHITAILGESVVFNCHVDFPGEHPVPYVLQWEKKVSEKVRHQAIPELLIKFFNHTKSESGKVLNIYPSKPRDSLSITYTLFSMFKLSILPFYNYHLSLPRVSAFCGISLHLLLTLKHLG